MKELWKWLVERCRENRLYRKILKTHCDRISFDHKDAGIFYLTREVKSSARYILVLVNTTIANHFYLIIT